MKLRLSIVCVTLLFVACTNNVVQIENIKKGSLQQRVKLEIDTEKKFELDSITAPRPLYTEIYKSPKGEIYFTFLNNYNNSIYIYDYNTLTYIRKITWDMTVSNIVGSFIGYHIKSMDSIYLYDKRNVKIVISNEKRALIKTISLRGNLNDSKWGLKYPQYNPQTVTPFIVTPDELLLTGFFFGSIPKAILSEFKFTAHLNFKTNSLKFNNTYPSALYGNNYNWDGELYTDVFSDLHPDGDKLVLSFPVSHDLFLANLKTGEYKKVFGGSNVAGTISSINKKPRKTTNEDIMSSVVRQDEYTAIKYDKFRKVYYRFLLKAIPQAPINTEWKEKPVAVIIMDENFKYLGETVIGKIKDWNWQNSFVTREGLNIEYIEKDANEKYLILKIFTLKKI